MYIKSPLNYTGRKYKLLNQILPLFSNNVKGINDVFCGSGDVFINTSYNLHMINDKQTELIEFMSLLKTHTIETLLNSFDKIINNYNLNKTNKEGYLKLRLDYNLNKNPEMFYILQCHSFSNQIRFNKSGGFNMPFGLRTFNEKMRLNLINFKKILDSKLCTFTNTDFRKINYYGHYLHYFDPPYLGSIATYNEHGGWSSNDDLDLFKLCDDLNNDRQKFAMSNVFENNGVVNSKLKKWAKLYNVHYLNRDYKGSNYQRKNKGKTVEVLVTNYDNDTFSK